jgi:hypothetical protein
VNLFLGDPVPMNMGLTRLGIEEEAHFQADL